MSHFLKIASVCLCLFTLLLTNSHADNNRSYADDYWLDWQEDVPTNSPDFDIKRSLEFRMGTQTHVQWLIDPKTVSIGEDSVVRYVVLAVSKSGAVNAMHEGILCKDSLYKTYARAIGKKNQPNIEWRPIDVPEWKKVYDTPQNSYQRVLTKLIMCDDNATPTNTRIILQRLKNPYNAPVTPTERWQQ